MTKYLAAYAAATLLMLTLDGLWLGLLAKDFYQQGLGHLMAESPRWGPALLFYALYPLGLLVFAVLPAGQDTGLAPALLRGALFGLMAYATYDLSNLATLKDWPVLVSVVDVAWGAFASCLATLAARLAYDRF
ncbi:DUF2177 domain-containing protein [Rhodoferax lacus]|uniref:DUF2177 domain-containing protein n=1 Tax=Rhodoferax lacus TaxID=2184758 RepID=A0A3E1RD19_9BURK|nr:DUF2177 family protein [Rhodoferax lacus]RFO97121.1 DUF2177 domain-containing protein [Rhodoferax lacus]